MIPARQIVRVSTQPGGTANGSSQNQLQPWHWEDSRSSLVVLHCPSQAARGLSDKAPAAKIAPLSMNTFPNSWVRDDLAALFHCLDPGNGARGEKEAGVILN